MKVANSSIVAAAAAIALMLGGQAIAGGYGMAPYGTGYGPGAGYGAPYGAPPMAYPQRPQRPKRPKRPYMGGPYGHGGGMSRPYMPGAYGMPGGYGTEGHGTPGGYATPGGYVTQQAAAPAKSAAPAEATESAAVSISQMRFAKPTVTIKIGGTVTWTNSESVPHTVTADDGSFGSARMGAGDTFSHTFDQPGTYSYSCQYHPMMRATVVVAG